MKPSRSEADVLRSIREALKALGIFHLRMNTGGFRDSHGQYVQFGTPGCADILAFPWSGKVLWIEVKSSTGKMSKDQELFQSIVETHGHTYLLARSAEEVVKEITVEAA